MQQPFPNTTDPVRSRTVAFAWAGLATLLFAFMFVLPKWADQSVSAVQVALLRYVAGFLAIAPVFWLSRRRPGRRGPSLHGYRLHFLRAVLGAGSVALTAHAVLQIPLANVQALNMTSGVFAALFAVWLLRERIGWRGGVAIAIALSGALVVAGPRFDAPGQWLSSGALAALLSAMAWGVDSVILKYTSDRDEPARLLFTVNGFACLILLGPGIYFWHGLSHGDVALLLAMGPIAICGQYCNIRAFRLAAAVDLSVIRYGGIVFAALFGFLFFDEWPTTAAMLGSVMICGGAFAMLRLGKRR